MNHNSSNSSNRDQANQSEQRENLHGNSSNIEERIAGRRFLLRRETCAMVVDELGSEEGSESGSKHFESVGEGKSGRHFSKLCFSLRREGGDGEVHEIQYNTVRKHPTQPKIYSKKSPFLLLRTERESTSSSRPTPH